MNKNDYQDYISQLDQAKLNKEIKHTIYVSRRAIWANIIWCLLSPIGGYIHTRRWKQLVILLISLFIFFGFTESEGSFKEDFERGQEMSPLIALIAMIDNGIAIKKARAKIKY